MPDISKIKLPSGSIYDIKDEVARQAMTGGMHFIGVSTTAITDGGDEIPTIDDGRVIPKNGDVVVYNKKEFVYSSNIESLSNPYIHLTTYNYTTQGYHIESSFDRTTNVLKVDCIEAGMSISFDVTYTANSFTLKYKTNQSWSSVNNKKLKWRQSGTSGEVELTLSTSFTKTFNDVDTTPIDTLYPDGSSILTQYMAKNIYVSYYNGHWAELGDLSDLGDLAYIDKDGDATKYLNGTGAWTVPPKNTAGSTDTSSKIFLIGATSQAASPQTYSHDTAYVGTDGCLYSGGTKVLTAHQTIKQDGVTGATVNRYASCSTAANTAAKTASITTGTFSLEAGSIVNVKFANTNLANSPTLNINSTGAKNIFSNGSQITIGENKGLLKGLCTFIYDGTQYHLVGGYIDTQYSLPIADYDTLGGVKPFLSRTGAVTGPTAATSSGAITVQNLMDAPLDYHPIEIDSTGRLFVNVPIDQVFNVTGVTSKNALDSGIQDAIYDNGRVNKGSGTTAVVIYGTVDITTAFTANSIIFEKCKYACTIEVDAYAPTGNTIARVFMQGLPSSGASVTNGALYFAEFSISSTDPLREPTVSWRKIGALAWKSSGTYDKTTGGSTSVSLKIPTSKTVALSVTTSAPAASTATGEVGYVASVSDETLTLNKIICTTGASITVPSSATAYTGTITPTHTSTNVTFS